MRCPNGCGECERDVVDNGVGAQPVGPWCCFACRWVEGDLTNIDAQGVIDALKPGESVDARMLVAETGAEQVVRVTRPPSPLDHVKAGLKRIALLSDVAKLEDLARATRDAALRRERDAFQARWGAYVKCSQCGGRVAAGGYAWDAALSPCCQAPVIKNGYAPPPERR